MEEFESQTEHVEEHLHEHAHHSGEKWISGVALTAALLAALAAATALLAGDHANEGIMNRIEANDNWAYYQATKLKAAMLETAYKIQGKEPNAKDAGKLADYAKKEKSLFADATKEQEESKAHFHRHTILAKGVTMFQVAIAVSAIAALTRRKMFWFVGMGLGSVGVGFLLWGLLSSTPKEAGHEAGATTAEVKAKE